MTWSIARLLLFVGCRFASTSEEKCSLFLCAAALYCANLYRNAPYCPVLPHVNPYSPIRPHTAHVCHVLPSFLAILPVEDKGGEGGAGATRARIWASGESGVGGAGAERGDRSVEHSSVPSFLADHVRRSEIRECELSRVLLGAQCEVLLSTDSHRRSQSRMFWSTEDDAGMR